MRRTPRLLAPPLLAALLLGGCTTPDPTPTPPHTTDAAPVFASDEEALAAAEEAYGKYIATVDAILNDGGASPERLEPLVSAEIYANEVTGFAEIAENGWRGKGATQANLSLQKYDKSELTSYVCEDISGTDILDGDGKSVVKPNRQTLLPYVVTFDLHDHLRILEKERWDGSSVC
ncbi:MAG: hypothetical protein QM598_06970 [Protaetiibacter sp.]